MEAFFFSDIQLVFRHPSVFGYVYDNNEVNNNVELARRTNIPNVIFYMQYNGVLCFLLFI